MPEDLTFYKDTGSVVRLPMQTPEKSVPMLFLGWSKSPNATQPEYTPGSLVDFTQDTTLYAVWQQDPGNIYMMIYNENIDSSSPIVELVNKNDNAVIIHPSARQGWLFLGWNTEPDGTGIAYAAGDTYTEKKTLSLYGQWRLETFSVCEVTFDLNRNPSNQALPSQFFKVGDWLRLSKTVPVWDPQHLFWGWNTDPAAIAPLYQPGFSYRFTGDTALYAIWKIEYHFISGQGNVCYRETTKQLRFIADGDRRYFMNVLLDDQLLPPTRYTVSSGSTIIDLPKATLDGLTLGKHTLQIRYEDGMTEKAAFYVALEPPATGDSGKPALWLALCALSALGLVVVMMVMRRKKRSR